MSPTSRGGGAAGTRPRAAGGPALVGPWDELSQEIRACTRCPLHATRHLPVIYRGAARPKVVFVGEAPGAQEDAQGVPFVGRSGQRLDRAIATIGPGVEPFGVLNLIKCRPPDNRFDRNAERQCRPFLDRQLELLDPEWIVPLGAHALAALVPGAPRISDAAGRLVRVGGRAYFPLLHPAAALHRPTLRSRWDGDLERLRAHLGPADPPAEAPTGSNR